MIETPGRFHSKATDHVVAGANEILDDDLQKKQSEINAETSAELGELKDKAYDPLTYSGLGRKYLRKNMINGINTLTQSMINQANTIYVIQYDFTLGEDITVPANCILEFDGGSLSNGNIVLQNTQFDGIVKFGADIEFSGTCANQTAYQNWFVDDNIDAFIRLINTEIGINEYSFSKGEYHPSTIINKVTDKDLIFRGNDCKLVYDNIESTGDTPLINIEGIQGDNVVFDVSENVDPTSTAIKVSSASISDLEALDGAEYLTIHDSTISSFSFQRNYQEGEFLQLKSVDTTNKEIIMQNHLYGYYQHAANGNVKVARVDFINVGIHGLEIIGCETNRKGLYLKFCSGTINNIRTTGFIKECMYIESCIDLGIIDCTCQTTKEYSGPDAYGLAVIDCQNVNIDGGVYYSQKHGITFGTNYTGLYSVINRHCVVKGCTCVSYSNQQSFNMHGGCQYFTISGINAKGIDIAGNDVVCIGNVVDGNIAIQEPIGKKFIISDNICSGYIDETLEQSTIKDYTREYGNCHIDTDGVLRITNNITGGVWINVKFYDGDFPAITDYTVDISGNSFSGFKRNNNEGIQLNFSVVGYVSRDSNSWKNVGSVLMVKNNTFAELDQTTAGITCDTFILTGNKNFREGTSVYTNKAYIEDNKINKGGIKFQYTPSIGLSLLLIKGNVVNLTGSAFIDVTANNMQGMMEHDFVKFVFDKNILLSGYLLDILENAKIYLLPKENIIIGGSFATHSFDNISYVSQAGFDGYSFIRTGYGPYMISEGKDKLLGLNQTQVRGSSGTRADLQDLRDSYLFMDSTIGTILYYVGETRGWITCDGYTAELHKHRSGARNSRPSPASAGYTNADRGFRYFDETVKKPLFLQDVNGNNATWVEADGASTAARRFGYLTQIPAADDIYVGFKYFCTDRRIDTDTASPTYMQVITVNSNIGGMELIHRGDNGWMDAIGRFVVCGIVNNFTHVTSNGDVSIEAGQTYNAILTAEAGYHLPAAISMKMGITSLTANTDFTYDSTTGAVSILGIGGTGGVSGNVRITAVAVED